MAEGKTQRDHVKQVMLNRSLMNALARHMAEKELDQSQSLLIALIEGYHSLGFLSDLRYQRNMEKYGKSSLQKEDAEYEELQRLRREKAEREAEEKEMEMKRRIELERDSRWRKYNDEHPDIKSLPKEEQLKIFDQIEEQVRKDYSQENKKEGLSQ